MVLLQGGAQAQTQTQAPASGSDAAGIISKMFKHYVDAKSMVGHIVMTQTAMNHSVSTQTDLAFELPAKLLVRQQLGGSNPMTWIVSSDGRYFSYQAPDDLSHRLIEPVSQSTSNVHDIYHAAGLSLGDRNLGLDATLGTIDDWKFLRNQWATVVKLGRDKVGGVDVDVVGGDWREYATAPNSATYQIFIADDGELKRFKKHDVVALQGPNGQTLPPTPVDTVWDFDLKIGEKPDASLFVLVR